MAIDFTKVAACGECCTECTKKLNGTCGGCIESDGMVPEWAGSGGCPIHKCARAHSVQFCGLCEDFPCDWLCRKITWNPDAINNLHDLAEQYRTSHIPSGI